MARQTGLLIFQYAIALLPTVIIIAGFGMVAGLRGWETLLWAVAGCLLVGTGIFTFLEVRRLTWISENRPEESAEEKVTDQYAAQILIVQPPTGEAYPHHEDYAESSGFDQGQLTSRIPGSTPLLDVLLEKKGSRPLRRT